MAFELRGTVYYKAGIKRSNHMAVFDFDHTLAQSDSGLIFMRTEDDWVPTSNKDSLLKVFNKLIQDDWTIIIVTNQYENTPEFTQKSLGRITNFLTDLGIFDSVFIYVSIADDMFRKPRTGIYNRILDDIGLTFSDASFYCGDAFGPQSDNPIYRWSDDDFQFAQYCGLAYYTPEEIFGTYHQSIQPRRVFLIMAAYESQYSQFVNYLVQNRGYVETNLQNAKQHLLQGDNIVVTGERLATRAGRRRAMHMIPTQYRENTSILMFTSPIFPFLDAAQMRAADFAIKGYANALDIHPQFDDIVRSHDEPFEIIRIN